MADVTQKQKMAPFQGRVLNARPDTIDFRDKIYTATLFEVPTKIELADYKQVGVPVLDQGQEGACTGFGLATVIHYLLRTRKVIPCTDIVSSRMLYEMAKKYDEWEGEDYIGSSARGAMKGWHKHGVCLAEKWIYDSAKPDKNLTAERAENAAGYPIGSYYRVNHKDLVEMHTALAEVKILYATARVHDGWFHLTPNGEIPYNGQQIEGGHAFAIVAFRENILDAYLFKDINQVQSLADEWMQDYNYNRPHEALGGVTPAYFKRVKCGEVENATAFPTSPHL